MFRLKHIMLPVLVLAFTALAVTFLQPIFTLKVRWAILGVVSLFTVVQNNILIPLRSPIGLIAATNVAWCLATSAWSESPELSILKGTAACIVILTSLAVGQFWVHQHSLAHSLTFLVPLAVVTAVAAIFGRYSSVGYDGGASANQLYQGLVSGPNMMGLMIAMSMPVVFWNLYQRWSKPGFPVFWLLAIGTLTVFLVMTRSRASTLIVVSSGIGMLWMAHPKARIKVILGGISLVAVLAISQTLLDNVGTFVRKSANTEDGVLATRVEVWRDSWVLAREGGLLGGGYGVTIGETGRKGFTWGFSAAGLGREKGNSQLAVLEEIGIIGFVLYLGLMAKIAALFVRSFKKLRSSSARAILGLVSGLLFGFFVQSCLEAWWVAPGSAEFLYFWVMVGVGIGLATDERMRGQTVVRPIPDQGSVYQFALVGPGGLEHKNN